MKENETQEDKMGSKNEGNKAGKQTDRHAT